MYNIGDLIRAAILRVLEGHLNEREMKEFETWLTEGDVAKYYFDRLLSLKAVATDLQTISREWGRPIDENALDILCKAFDAREIGKQISDTFPRFETFIQFKDAEIDSTFVGLAV
jgi:hypothetical protein